MTSKTQTLFGSCIIAALAAHELAHLWHVADTTAEIAVFTKLDHHGADHDHPEGTVAAPHNATIPAATGGDRSFHVSDSFGLADVARKD
jgi:hypothetical protein